MAFRDRPPNDDSLNGLLVLPAAAGRSTGWAAAQRCKGALTVIDLNLPPALALGWCAVTQGHSGNRCMARQAGKAVAGRMERTVPGEPGAANGPIQPNRSRIMSEHQQDRFEMPKGMRSMAEAGFDQARKGFEQFLAGAQLAKGSIEERGATVRAGARDIGAKAFACA